MEDLISKIKHALQVSLPGYSAQKLMEPTSRLQFKIPDKPVKAAVLILLYYKENSLFNVLIKRPVYSGHHSGQISFPGGKFDELDKNLTNTALRETYEELGVNSNNIEILGNISPLIIPVSKFKVLPVIGFYKKASITFTPDEYEVFSVIEYPIKILLSESIAQVKTITYNNIKVKIPYFNINNEEVWGATAMILSEFRQIILSCLKTNS